MTAYGMTEQSQATETRLALVRYSPAWCIFFLGLTAVVVATIATFFTVGELVAMRLLAPECFYSISTECV